MEEAGFVAFTRQISFGNASGAGSAPERPSSNGVLGALARIERLDFLLPVEVGDVVQIEGEVDFATEHSCRVSLEISAAHLRQPEVKERRMRLTNRARLWYVSKFLSADGKMSLCQMPRVDLSDIDENRLFDAKRDYLDLKEKRKRKDGEIAVASVDYSNPDVDLLLSRTRSKDSKPGTVAWTKSAHSVLVNHHDCDVAGNLSGGALMKMADEVAALAASKHTLGGTPTTAAMDTVNFNKTIPKGSFVHLESEVTFAGGKSCEVYVRGDAVNIYAPGGPVAIPRAMEARFTFVTFGPDGMLLPMPDLTPVSKEELYFYQLGKERYERRKRERSG